MENVKIDFLWLSDFIPYPDSFYWFFSKIFLSVICLPKHQLIINTLDNLRLRHVEQERREVLKNLFIRGRGAQSLEYKSHISHGKPTKMIWKYIQTKIDKNIKEAKRNPWIIQMLNQNQPWKLERFAFPSKSLSTFFYHSLHFLSVGMTIYDFSKVNTNKKSFDFPLFPHLSTIIIIISSSNWITRIDW